MMTQQFWDPFSTATEPEPETVQEETPVEAVAKAPRIETASSLRRQATRTATEPVAQAAPPAPAPASAPPEPDAWRPRVAEVTTQTRHEEFGAPTAAVATPAVVHDILSESCFLLMAVAGDTEWPTTERGQRKLLRRARAQVHPDLDMRRGPAERQALWLRAAIAPTYYAHRPVDDNVEDLWAVIEQAAKRIGLV